MRRLLPTAAFFAALALPPLSVTAAPPPASRVPSTSASAPDVPAHHWAAGSVGRVLHQHILGRDPDGRFRGDQPVTRYELAVALDRFVRYIEAGRTPLHAQTYPATIPAAAKAPPAARQAMQHLVSGGFLPATSPLITQNGRKAVTAQELTDALAAVTIRLSDRAEAPHKE